MNMCEWPTGCTERAKVTHMDINTRVDSESKQMTKKKRKLESIDCISLPVGDHTPSF